MSAANIDRAKIDKSWVYYVVLTFGEYNGIANAVLAGLYCLIMMSELNLDHLIVNEHAPAGSVHIF
jgi:hypothetical protein